MKTWYVTTVAPGSNGQYDQVLAGKLNYLEGQGHTIFMVTNVSGGLSILSYTT